MNVRLTLATYNIRHAVGMDNQLDLSRIATTLRDIGADVACLQEVDCRVPRSKRIHQPSLLARWLGMKAVFGPTLRWPLGALYGNLLLSRLPLEEFHVHILPEGKEPRGLVEAHVRAPGGMVAVFCTHWGLTETERVIQAGATLEHVRACGLPALLAGDLNETPDSRGHDVLREGGMVHLGPDTPTFPAPDPEYAIDHVYGSPGWRALDAYAIPSLASDHRPVAVELAFDGHE